MKILLLLLVLSAPALAAPSAHEGTITEEGVITCYTCFFDLLTGLNIYETWFTKPEPDVYEFYGWIFPSQIRLHPDPMLEGMPPKVSTVSTVPLPNSFLLMTSALMLLVGRNTWTKKRT